MQLSQQVLTAEHATSQAVQASHIVSDLVTDNISHDTEKGIT